MEEVKVKSNYKDTIFRMLFSDKENLLSLYNALNGTDYTDTEHVLQSLIRDEEGTPAGKAYIKAVGCL